MAARKKSADEDINIIDLTELIEKGGDTEPRKAQVHVEHDDSDIEALLADMEAGDTTPSGASAKKVDANEKLDMSDMGGLDDLFNDFDLPAQPEAASKSLDNVVDDLMGVGDNSSAASGSGASFADELDGFLDEASSGNASGHDDIDESLDSLYASLEEKDETAKASASPVDSDLNDILSAVDKQEVAAQKAAPAASGAAPEDFPADLDDLLAAADKQEAPAQKAAPAASKAAPADFPDDLDDLLNGSDEPAPKPQKPAAESDASRAGKAAPAKAAAEKLPEKLLEEAKGAEEELAAELGMEMPAPKVRQMTDSQQNFALNANLENLNFQARDLGMRLQNCEADLAKTRQRMEGLEKSAANAASIEDLLRDGSPLHTGFAALIASSVGQVIQDARANGPDPQTLNKLHQLEIGSKGAQSRLDAMESRINDLEKQSLDSVQLAEKLGDLVQDGDNAAQRMDAVENRFEAMLPQIEKSAQLADHYDELLHVSARLSALENTLGQLSGKLEGTETHGENLDRMAQEISALADRLSLQQQKIEELSGNINSGEIVAKMAEVEKQLADRQEEQARSLEEMSLKITALSDASDGDEKIEALGKQIAELAASPAENLSERLVALEEQTAAALAKAEETGTRLAGIDLAKALAPLETAFSRLEEEAGKNLDAQNDKIEALAARCDTLTEKLAAVDTDARLEKVETETGHLREGLLGLEKELSKAQNADALAPLESRLGEMESRIQEEAKGNAASFEELTQKIDQLGQGAGVEDKLARIESDAQSAKIRVLAIEDKFAELAKKDDITPLENSLQEIDGFAKKGQAELASRIGDIAEKQAQLENSLHDMDDLAKKNHDGFVSQIEELVEKQAQLLKNGAELEALAESSRKNGERIEDIAERLAGLDLEKTLQPLKSDIHEIDEKARKIAAQEETLASHAEALGNLDQKLGELSRAAGQNEAQDARLTGLENEAKELGARIVGLEGKVDALPGIENVETSLMAQIGGVKQEVQASRENLDILENRLGVLEARKDSESSIDMRLESMVSENAVNSKRLQELEESVKNLARETKETAQTPAGVDELQEGLQNRIENFEKKLLVLEEIAMKTSEIASQLQALDTTAKSVAYRMDAVEARLDNLEPRFNKEIEKAATSVVSRILREEIGRLLTNE